MCDFHDLRHTAATRLAKKMQLVFVGNVLGHSDPKTTRRYVNKTRQTILDAAMIMDEWHQRESVQVNDGWTGELVH
jgi:integrase